MIVTFDKNKDFTADLSCAAIINTLEEIEKIINIVKSKKYTCHKILAREINKLVTELDPVDKETTISCILENIHPEQRKLLDPINIILSSSCSKKKFCFI